MKTATVRKVWLETHQQWAHFQHRDTMRRMARPRATLPPAFPVTPLPIDVTGNATASCPLDDNDTLGICGPAMCDHLNGIRSYGQGKAGFVEVHADLTKLVDQYEQVSGGDNGTDEAMLVGPGGIWTADGGGLAGDPDAVVVDHLDIDITDAQLAQFCTDNFYGLCMAWSVPDDFLRLFSQGTVWDNADTPDPNNGHFTAMADYDAAGRIRCWTWGSWCWMGPAFVASVQPACFVTFSALQFRGSDGYDSKGRHVGDVAANWLAIGGNPSLVAPVVSRFPPKVRPPAPPAPTPTGAPTLVEAQAAVAASIGAGEELQRKEDAIAAANAGLAVLYGAP